MTQWHAGLVHSCACDAEKRAMGSTHAQGPSRHLFLALECSETPGNGNIDSHERSHFMFSTTPVGNDASQWSWIYVGEFATGADASKLGSVEGASYAFFTEPQLVATKSGQLAILITPGAFAPTSDTQPVIRSGCRIRPIALTATSVSLTLDCATGAPARRPYLPRSPRVICIPRE